MHQRGLDGGWIERVAIAGGRVEVPSVGAILVIDEIYRASSVGR